MLYAPFAEFTPALTNLDFFAADDIAFATLPTFATPAPQNLTLI